jgi:cell division protein FtsN
MSSPRLSSRDYKTVRRAPIEFARLKQFGLGLAAGLVVAGIVFVADHRRPQPVVPPAKPAPRKPVAGGADTPAVDSAAASATDTTDDKFDFYKMLPKFEVVVPEEKEHGSRVAPTAKINRPGIYFLQAGSYQNDAQAERVRAQLAKLGIDATVQRVAVDADVWHRVRIGPIRDLDKLNRLRTQLSGMDLDALVIRVDD